LEPEPLFIRGDVNWDGDISLTDPILVLNSLFLTGDRLDCADAADMNDDGQLDISDAITTLTVLYLGGAATHWLELVSDSASNQDRLGCE
jgi:hypothetical protein